MSPKNSLARCVTVLILSADIIPTLFVVMCSWNIIYYYGNFQFHPTHYILACNKVSFTRCKSHWKKSYILTLSSVLLGIRSWKCSFATKQHLDASYILNDDRKLEQLSSKHFKSKINFWMWSQSQSLAKKLPYFNPG